MSEFLSRLGGAALNDLKGTPLDRIVNHLMGGQPGASGLQALADRLREAGLGDRIDSWIGTGENRPVQPAELERAIPEQEANRLAQDAGMERPGLLALLSQVLPKLVDSMTPDGRISQDGAAAARSASGPGAAGAMPQGGPDAASLGGAGGEAGRPVGQGAGGEAGMRGFGESPTDDTPSTATGPLGPRPGDPGRSA